MVPYPLLTSTSARTGRLQSGYRRKDAEYPLDKHKSLIMIYGPAGLTARQQAMARSCLRHYSRGPAVTLTAAATLRRLNADRARRVCMAIDIPVNEPLLDGNERTYVLECLETNWISSEGPFVARFEEQFAAAVGRRYGIAVCNGSAAAGSQSSSLHAQRGLSGTIRLRP